MNLHLTFSTAKRVLQQLRHDKRSMAMILLVPLILITILYFVFYENEMVFNGVAPMLVGLIPFTIMFIITSVAMLRERTSGTLERLLVSKLSKLDILSGYALAFGFLAFIQAALTTFVTMVFLDVTIAGDVAPLVLIAVLSGISGMAFGLFLSSFAKNEFQAVQFMPAFVLPQFLICGLFMARENMAEVLYQISNFMPLSYIVDAMKSIQSSAVWSGELTKDITILVSFTVVSLVLGAISLKSD